MSVAWIGKIDVYSALNEELGDNRAARIVRLEDVIMRTDPSLGIPTTEALTEPDIAFTTFVLTEAATSGVVLPPANLSKPPAKSTAPVKTWSLTGSVVVARAAVVAAKMFAVLRA